MRTPYGLAISNLCQDDLATTAMETARRAAYHPLLAIAAGTGDVLMSRLREGRANTARGAAHFLRETVGRVRYAGARSDDSRYGPTAGSTLMAWYPSP